MGMRKKIKKIFFCKISELKTDLSLQTGKVHLGVPSPVKEKS